MMWRSRIVNVVCNFKCPSTGHPVCAHRNQVNTRTVKFYIYCVLKVHLPFVSLYHVYFFFQIIISV